MSRTEEAVKDTHCYVGVAKCGCRVAVVLDEVKYPKDTAASVAEFIKDGYEVHRETIDQFRASGGLRHTCGKEKTKGNDTVMFAPTAGGE